MQEFKIRPEGLVAIRKRILFRTTPIGLVAGGIGVAISFTQNDIDNSWLMLAIVIPIMALFVSFGMYRAIKRQTAIFKSYTVTLTANLISREADNLPTVAIYLADIRRVVVHRSGSIVIRGKDPRAVIGVPPEMEDYEDLKAALNQIKPIEARRNDVLWSAYRMTVGLITIALMAGVYLLQNKILVAVCGTLTVGILIWGFIATRRNRNIDIRVKRRVWWMLIVAASIIYLVVKKWTS